MPRLVRDPSAIKVTFPGGQNIGNGSPELGGGLLRGGVTLLSRVVAEIEDPALPYAITVTVAARDGFIVAESMTIAERPSGPPLASAAIRQTGLSLYVQRIREELPRVPGFLGEKRSETDRTVSFGFPPVSADWEAFAEMRRATRLTPEVAAEAYLEALDSLDPEKNRKPTQAAAEKLGISRGHAGRLITEARKKGVPGLGPGRPARRRPKAEQDEP